MNQFANALFSAFFSWLKSVILMIYRAVSQPDRASLLSFIARHWVVLLVIFLVVGTAIDLTVYFFRWRPFEVWASFFRRQTGRSRQHSGLTGRRTNDEPVRRVEAVPTDDAYVIPNDGLQRTPENLTYVDPMTDIDYSPAEGREEPWEEIMEQEANLEDEPVQEFVEEKRKRRHTPTRPRKGLRELIRKILAEEEEETGTLRYTTAQPPVDARDAYGEPYIPPQWKTPEPPAIRRKRSEKEYQDE